MKKQTQETNATETVAPTTPTIPTKTNKAALVRVLLKQKKTAKQIAAEVGCKPQYVYSVQNHDRVKARKAKAKRDYERRKEIAAGSVKRKYVKSGKYSKKVKSPLDVPMVEIDRDRLKAEQTELHELNAHFIKQLQEATTPKIQYIEIEVPQPHYNLTWSQRFKALFTGRV
jgi:hypothetical protein